MKKIIGIIHPFDIHQRLYVYQDGNKLEMRYSKLNNISEDIIELAYTYDIQQVDLSGAKQFSQGIVKEIQKKELTRYNTNKIIVKCI